MKNYILTKPLFMLIGLVLLNMLFNPEALAADHICNSGTDTFSPAANDRVIATDSCQAVTINCGSNDQCTNLTVFAAAQTVEISCTGKRSCQDSIVNIGLGSDSLTYPNGYSAEDFDGVVQDFNLLCGNSRRDDYTCQNVELNTFQDVLNQTVDCNTALYACTGMNATLFNSNTDPDADFNLLCGTNDRFQCDASNFIIESAGVDFQCTGITCIYTGCPEIGCFTTNDPPDIEDPDNDGQSAYFDEDDDGDGIDDIVEESLGLDPNDPSDANNDLDNDGLTNLEEVENGTDPTAIESSSVDEALSISPKFHRFGIETLNDANCQQNATPVTYTISNKSANAVAVNSLLITGIDSAFDNEFQVISSSDQCSGQSLIADSSCEFQVVHCPQGQAGETGSSAAAFLEVNTDSESTPVIEAALSSFEGVREEAQRRLPPVASSLSIEDAQSNPITQAELPENSSFTINYTVSGYHDSYDVVGVLFDCTGININQCGLSFNHMISNSGFISPASQSQGSWDYQGEQISEFSYSFPFSTPDLVDGEGDKTIVIRFYQKSSYDILGGKFSLSLILPGNLPLDYIDSSGRRVAFTVKNDN